MTETDRELDTDVLAGLIEEKRKILRHLHDLSRRQSEVVGCGELHRLLGVLAAKQSHLAQLQQVERQLDPFRHQDPDRRAWRSAEARRKTQLTASQCEEMLAQIVGLEQECESQMVRQRDAIEHRLRGIHETSRARTAYLQTDFPTTGQLDISSESSF